MGYNFCSDNTTPMAPPVLKALTDANAEAAMPYGNDDWSQRLDEAFSKAFDRDVTVFPVATGTAANGLALAQLTPHFGAIICHQDAHILVDECGAPEFFTGGARLSPIDGAHGKIHAGDLDAFLSTWERTIHNVQPAVVSVTQLTEWGTAYSPIELSDLSAVAKAHKIKVHMDGARFANALAALGCRPADITWKAGVDVLCFGASKNGCMAGEAVIFFDPELAENFAFRRKRSGHLWSKSRFLAAQWLAYLADDNWLAWATHANAMAHRMAAGLQVLPGVNFIARPEGNEIYLDMPETMVTALKTAGFSFYDMPIQGRKANRIVTAWNTPEDEVDTFLAVASQAV